MGPKDFRRCLEELRPKIGRYGWLFTLLRLRARQKGYFPDRTYRMLLKATDKDRPYFIGQTPSGIRYLGDVRDEYSVWFSIFPERDAALLRLLQARAAALDGTFIDVGANVGIFAATAARAAAGRGGDVVAIECMPATARRAAASFALNGLTNVRLVVSAVGNADGSLELYDVPGHSDVVSAYKSRQIEHAALSKVVVPCCTLDGLAQELGLGKLGLLKVDVEGCELDVFRGATALLRRDRPEVLYEYNPPIAGMAGWGVADVETCLAKAGIYEFDVLHDNGRISAYPPPCASNELVNVICRPVLLPLPPGEGWGEGKPREMFEQPVRHSQFPLTPTLSRREREESPKLCQVNEH
jgi:FkbM family methyltransferase